MKTNREKNQEYDQRQQAKIRPKVPKYNFEPLQELINKWSKQNEHSRVL